MLLIASPYRTRGDGYLLKVMHWCMKYLTQPHIKIIWTIRLKCWFHDEPAEQLNCCTTVVQFPNVAQISTEENKINISMLSMWTNFRVLTVFYCDELLHQFLSFVDSWMVSPAMWDFCATSHYIYLCFVLYGATGTQRRRRSRLCQIASRFMRGSEEMSVFRHLTTLPLTWTCR